MLAGTIEGAFLFSDSRPRAELLRSDKIEIVKLSEPPRLAGTKHALWTPWSLRGGAAGGLQVAQCPVASDRCLLTYSGVPHSAVWNHSGVSCRALAMDVDAHGASCLHLSPGGHQSLASSAFLSSLSQVHTLTYCHSHTSASGGLGMYLFYL